MHRHHTITSFIINRIKTLISIVNKLILNVYQFLCKHSTQDMNIMVNLYIWNDVNNCFNKRFVITNIPKVLLEILRILFRNNYQYYKLTCMVYDVSRLQKKWLYFVGEDGVAFRQRLRFVDISRPNAEMASAFRLTHL